MIGLWTIDIGVSGIATEPFLKEGHKISATNGWWSRTPAQEYHLGIWLVIAGILGEAAAVIGIATKEQG